MGTWWSGRVGTAMLKRGSSILRIVMEVWDCAKDGTSPSLSCDALELIQIPRLKASKQYQSLGLTGFRLELDLLLKSIYTLPEELGISLW